MKSWMKVLLLILAGVLALGVGAFGSLVFSGEAKRAGNGRDRAAGPGGH